MRKIVRYAFCGVVSLGLVALVPTAVSAQDVEPERLTLTEVEGELGEGNAYTFEHGVLRVPQNRANPDGPVVELEFTRFPRLPGADPSVPPIVHLNGGPGWPGLGREPQMGQHALQPLTVHWSRDGLTAGHFPRGS